MILPRTIFLVLLCMALAGGAMASALARVDPDIFDGSRRPKAEPHPALEAASRQGAVPRDDTPAQVTGGAPAGEASAEAPAGIAGAGPASTPAARAGATPETATGQSGPEMAAAEGRDPAHPDALPEAPSPVTIGDPTAMIRIARPAAGVREPVGARPDPAASKSPGDRLDPLSRPAGAQNPNEVRGGVDPGATVPPHL